MNPNDYSNDQQSMSGYSNAYLQYGQRGRRSSSTASHAQFQPLQPQSYEPQDRSNDLSGQYAYVPVDEWQNFDLPHPQLPESVTNTSININEIQGLSTSADEGPWIGSGVAYGSRLQTHPSYWSSSSTVPKAHTVAAQPAAEVYQRPAFKPRLSSISIADSGFVSAAPLSAQSHDVPQSSPSNNSFTFRAIPQIDIPHSTAQPGSVKSDPNPHGAPEVVKRRRSKGQVPPCPQCGKSLKNQSDASKHELTHTRPFRCTVYRCPRKEGFATRNDLERHRKSVHLFNPEVGKKTGHICRACPAPGPGAGPKWWPRLDNFKAHIQRKHKEMDMEELIKSSESVKPDDTSSDPGYCSQPTQSHAPDDRGYQHDLSSPLAHGMGRHPSQQGDFTSMFESEQYRLDTLAGVGAVADQFYGRRESGGSFPRPRTSASDGSGMSALCGAAQQLASPLESMMLSPIGSRHSMPEIPPVTVYAHYGYQSQQYGRASQQDGSPKRQRLSGSTGGQHESASSARDNDHTCTECGKTKKRECDLRKHMKRHTRPYGCTFPNCVKRFGSRNDWKRHECSQHNLQEMWRCGYNRQDGNECGRLAYHRDKFAQHLHRRHEIALDSEQSKNDCKSMHLGREGHHRFWCGFCNRLIQQQDTLYTGAWDLRFKHIGDHFDKNNYHIDEWIDIEENKKKGLIAVDGRRRPKRRSSSGRFDDDDSDLGEAGIPEPYAPGYAAPGSQASASYGPTQSSGHVSSRRRMDTGDMDADGVSDEEYGM